MNAKRKTWMANLLIFLSVLGPGIITGSVDNDAGGITAYSVAGATYGYKLLWSLFPCFIVLLVVQEMNARMGIVTGKGLADLIRENFGVKVTFFIFIGLIIADIGNTATEFAGVAGSMQVFGVSKYVSVPLAAIAVWILVVKGTYKTTEKLFLVFSLFLLSYIASAFLAKPDWHEIGSALIHPTIETNFDYIGTVIGIVGTTIAPWMQFYMQSAVIEKGLKVEDFKYEFWDVVVGSVITVVVAFFIIVACGATLYKSGIQIEEAKDAAVALKPLAGAFSSQIFAFGLFIASIFSATILPLATAFYICEAFGFEAGINKTLKEAPEFFTLFTIIIIVGIAIILIPGAPLIQITLGSQVINGMLLPVVLICMMLIVNNKEIMGEYVNDKIKNSVGWVTIVVLIILTAILTFESIATAFLK
ncbi:Nramp family divalent metal transporter [Clostridium uliginosum]|uniref:NRAMP (Natural resistance-associated macrophage protein) metal ion transporters n=1 Tax=Clostridium uliginosum TaxID=119641 RepID=A0A1I1QAW4_9CLOT|nr:Nramp family divalent metal transporter [Clostridium uliginosum]SFD15280.1 NRAMP (natural resistance-associated macrophage protein) metal ion transporters [Clostridium uliginosum]